MIGRVLSPRIINPTRHSVSSGEMASFKNLIFVENKSDTEDDKKTATSLLEKIVTKDNFFAIQINKQDFENEEELLGLVEKYKHIKFVMV